MGRNLSLGAKSVDSVASEKEDGKFREDPDVKLTKFRRNLLFSGSIPLSSGRDCRTDATDGGRATKTLDAAHLLIHQVSSSSSSSMTTSSNHHPTLEDSPDSFRVVWSRLSFRVRRSAYEQLTSGSVERTIDLWSHLWSWALAGLRRLTGGRGGATSPPSNPGGKQRPTGERVIFDNLNGSIKSGEISAILGPSGSGKTSLLNAICGQTVTQRSYKGSVRLEGSRRRARLRLSIIPQKDYLVDNLTVRENLLFASRMQNASDEFDHESNILQVVRMLNLSACYESKAANLSGGEHKRVSIAQELLRRPDILVLDEPTSGLDSLNCKNLVRSLVHLVAASRQGAINPIAIVLTIHQPDAEIFHMFDHVYCMARAGRVVFDGSPSAAVETLRTHSGLSEQLGHQQWSPPVNPANLLIEVASEVFGQEPIERLAQFQRKQFEGLVTRGLEDCSPTTANKSHESSAKTSMDFFLDMFDLTSSSSPPQVSSCAGELVRDKRLVNKDDHSGRFLRHTNLLARRAFTSTLRDPLITFVSFIFHLSVPIAMWLIYSKDTGKVHACPLIQREMELVSLVSNQTMGVVERLQDQLITALECSTMFFMSTYAFSMCSLSVAALEFPTNMHVLLKEVRNGWYNLPAFVVAKSIANFPFEVVLPVVSVLMIYLSLEMPNSQLGWRMCAIALVIAMVSMISHTQGLIFGALCMDSVQTAIFLASSTSLPLALLSGFTARVKQMPQMVQHLSWLSLYRYSCDSINIIRFGFGLCPCDSSTVDYMRAQSPIFTDVPSNLKPLFTYYLTAGNQQANDTVIDNSSSSLIDLEQQEMSITGIANFLTLNQSERAHLLDKLETNDIDMFGRLAELLARSFTYGRNVRTCADVRSQLLVTSDTPRDESLPMLFVGMLMLLLTVKLLLFLVVRWKVGRRA